MQSLVNCKIYKHLEIFLFILERNNLMELKEAKVIK